MAMFKRMAGEERTAGIPRIGKIHLGVKAQSAKGNEYPKAVDFFVCPPEVQAVYGDKPRELDVLLPHDDLEEIMPVALKFYRQGTGLYCTGNGEIAKRRKDGGGWEDRGCPCEEKDRGKCKKMANLRVFLPKVSLGGVYQIDTSSDISISNIQDGCNLIRQVAKKLALVPATLKIEPVEVAPDGKKKVVWVLKMNLPTFAVIGALQGEMIAIRDALDFENGKPALPPADQEDGFEEEYLIPASVQKALPNEAGSPTSHVEEVVVVPPKDELFMPIMEGCSSEQVFAAWSKTITLAKEHKISTLKGLLAIIENADLPVKKNLDEYTLEEWRDIYKVIQKVGKK